MSRHGHRISPAPTPCSRREGLCLLRPRTSSRDSQDRREWGSGKTPHSRINMAAHRQRKSMSLSKSKSAVRQEMLVTLGEGVSSLLCDSFVHSAVHLYAPNAPTRALYSNTKTLKVALFPRATVWPGSRTCANKNSKYILSTSCRPGTGVNPLYV